jgi:hypothetical protein
MKPVHLCIGAALVAPIKPIGTAPSVISTRSTVDQGALEQATNVCVARTLRRFAEESALLPDIAPEYEWLA